MIRKTTKGDAELVLLDHGLYQEVPEKVRTALNFMWKAIVLNDHVNMKKYSNELGVESKYFFIKILKFLNTLYCILDYELFAGILTQTPLRVHGFKLTSKLSEDDMKRMTEFAKDRFDSVMCCLQAMPRTLLLVLR